MPDGLSGATPTGGHDELTLGYSQVTGKKGRSGLSCRQSAIGGQYVERLEAAGGGGPGMATRAFELRLPQEFGNQYLIGAAAHECRSEGVPPDMRQGQDAEQRALLGSGFGGQPIVRPATRAEQRRG